MADLVQVKVKGNVGTIDDNLDAVEASIREKIKEYKAVVITEDSVADGQKFRASVNKEKKALDEERKEIKKEWMKPYDEFEKKAKKIIALYDEPLKVIDEQLDEFEKRRKETKKQEIQAAYDFVKGDLGDWLPLERIYNPKWENKTYASKTVREDIEKEFNQLRMYIDTIESTHTEFKDDAMKVLKETGDLQAALTEINNLEKQKERFMEQARREAEQERLAKETAEKAEKEEQERLAKDEAETVQAEEPEELKESEEQQAPQKELEEAQAPTAFELPFGYAEPEFDESPFECETMYTVKVRVSESNLDDLKTLLDSIGYEYEVE